MASGDKQELDFGPALRTAGKEQKLFGRYTLKRVLGRGGMGIVWLAHDDELIRYVAMKFLPDMLVRDREAVEDLKRETRRSLDLTHHHIVRIYDFTQDEMCAAIIMEFVDGETLSAMKSQQPTGCFGVSQVAAWVAHFASALDYAHRQARVVHRDLKPANLMINSRGDLKITDFGISRSMSDSMTRVSVSNTAGTLAYMSPEQALGAPPTPGDDIYAFGATVYDLLTGRPPFFRGNLQVQLETVIPPRMEDRRTELGNSAEPIPELWQEVIASCLAKRPQDRPQSIAEVAALLGLAGATSGTRPGSTGSGSAGTASGTRTRSAGDETAADSQSASGTARPSTSRPSSGPRPTGLDDILGATSPREELVSPQARVTAAPGREGGASQTIPPEDLTLAGQKGASLEHEPPTLEKSGAPAPVEAKSSTHLPPREASTPARKSSTSGLAVAAFGSLALVAAGGAWWFMGQRTPEPSASTPVVSVPATPAPDFDKQIVAIRELIAAEKLASAQDLIGALPADLPAIADLKTEMGAKQAEVVKREEEARLMAARGEVLTQLIKDADARLAAKDWTAARLALATVLKQDDQNAEALSRMKTLEKAQADDEAAKMKTQRESEFRAALDAARQALTAGDFAKAHAAIGGVPAGFSDNAELIDLCERIDRAAKAAAMAAAPPEPKPAAKRVEKESTPKPKKPERTTERKPARENDNAEAERRAEAERQRRANAQSNQPPKNTGRTQPMAPPSDSGARKSPFKGSGAPGG